MLGAVPDAVGAMDFWLQLLVWPPMLKDDSMGRHIRLGVRVSRVSS